MAEEEGKGGREVVDDGDGDGEAEFVVVVDVGEIGSIGIFCCNCDLYFLLKLSRFNRLVTAVISREAER